MFIIPRYVLILTYVLITEMVCQLHNRVKRRESGRGKMASGRTFTSIGPVDRLHPANSPPLPLLNKYLHFPILPVFYMAVFLLWINVCSCFKKKRVWLGLFFFRTEEFPRERIVVLSKWWRLGKEILVGKLLAADDIVVISTQTVEVGRRNRMCWTDNQELVVYGVFFLSQLNVWISVYNFMLLILTTWSGRDKV